MKRSWRFKLFMFILVVNCIGMVTFVVEKMTKKSTAVEYKASFNPLDYGLPDYISGYKVMAVLSENNVNCMAKGKLQLILYPDPTQRSNQDIDFVEAFIRSYDYPLSFSIEHRYLTFNDIKYIVQTWNEANPLEDCDKAISPLATLIP